MLHTCVHTFVARCHRQDWSTDGRFIASVCLGYELLFHKITPSFKGSARENAPAVKNAQWATTTCKFGWAVNGIFRPDQVWR
jgi:hypothetical protein